MNKKTKQTSGAKVAKDTMKAPAKGAKKEDKKVSYDNRWFLPELRIQDSR